MTAGRDLARRLFAALAAETADPPGVTRASYGPGEQIAHDLVRREAAALGCEIVVDAAGNLYMTKPGRDRALPALMTGSHLDSVPHGGNFDGAAGVIAGLWALADLAAAGNTLQRDVTVVAFRAEEAAWFPLSYPGSYAAFGRLETAALDTLRSDTGLTLAHHLSAAGFDPEAVRRGEAHLAPERIAAFVEVHIEQGPALIGDGLPLGLVTAIYGGFRHMQARARGAWAHSGATPRRFRRDAALAVADLAIRLETTWDRIEAAGLFAVITFGVIATDPTMHGGSRVAGEVAFSLDVRSADEAALDMVRGDLVAFAAEIQAARGVTLEFGPEFTWPIAAMSAPLLDQLEVAARAAGVRAQRMPSGAGHDAAVFAEIGAPTAMLFVRNANGSHNPHESMELGDLGCAAATLVAWLLAEAGEAPLGSSPETAPPA